LNDRKPSIMKKLCKLIVERPTKFELANSLKTATPIGVDITANVLARTDRVIR